MGRTLHYGIKGKIRLTKEQKDKLFTLTARYHKEYKWQYEKVWFPPLYTLPKNIASEDEPGNEDDVKKSENISNAIIQELECSGVFGSETIKVVDETELEFDDTDKLYGFTKVYGNEIDAHNVIKFVVDSSIILPEREFYFFDEGEALYCPLFVKNGLAIPDVSHISKILACWNKGDGFRDGGLWDITSKEKFYKALVKEWEWSDIQKFVRPLKEKKNAKKRKELGNVNLSMDDLENFPSIALDFLLEERLEMMKYYDDMNNFPEEI
jgi:hypothetical protein